MTHNVKEGLEKRDIYFCSEHSKAWDSEGKQCCKYGSKVGWVEVKPSEDDTED